MKTKTGTLLITTICERTNATLHLKIPGTDYNGVAFHPSAQSYNDELKNYCQ